MENKNITVGTYHKNYADKFNCAIHNDIVRLRAGTIIKKAYNSKYLAVLKIMLDAEIYNYTLEVNITDQFMIITLTVN